MSSTANVKDVKEQLQTQVSIPVDQQKLIFQGKSLSGIVYYISDLKIVSIIFQHYEYIIILFPHTDGY